MDAVEALVSLAPQSHDSVPVNPDEYVNHPAFSVLLLAYGHVILEDLDVIEEKQSLCSLLELRLPYLGCTHDNDYN